MTTANHPDQTSLTITFLHSRQNLFQLTLQSSKSLSVKQVLSHIVKTISLDIKQNPDAFFVGQDGSDMFVYADQELKHGLEVSMLAGQVSQKLFYNLSKEQLDMLLSDDFETRNRVEKPMKANNLQRKFKQKKVHEEPMPQPIIQLNQELSVKVTLIKNQTQNPEKQSTEPLEKQGKSTHKSSNGAQKQILLPSIVQQQKVHEQIPLKPKEVSQPKLQVTKSLQTVQIQKKVPNESTHTKTQSTYFQNQPNLSQNNNQFHPIPISYHQIEQLTQHQVQQANQQEIVGQNQLRSQSAQQIKEDSCCQII